MTRFCWFCHMADCCPNWLDKAPYTCLCHEREEQEYATLGLCKGRHALPECEGFFFDHIEDPSDVVGMEETAMKVLSQYTGLKRVDLYVTGLSMALVAVINACRACDVELVLWHYNAKTGKYFLQRAN